MKRWQRILHYIFVSLLVLLVVGPFLVPVPPLEEMLPPAQLADPDSKFVEVNSLSVHYKELGSGGTTFILLHGFGASLFSWREVMALLANYGQGGICGGVALCASASQ